jgi:uncharacterized protein YcbX
MIARVVSLHVYPVKSCGGIEVDSMPIGRRGPLFDREWMIVDEKGEFLTQRQCAEMALVKTQLTETLLAISIPNGRGGTTEVTLPKAIETGTQTTEVRVWGDPCQAYEAAPLASRALSDFLGRSVRIVRMAKFFKRQFPEKYSATAQTGFADLFPLLLTTTESLGALNDKLAEKVPMDRFRPNIVIEGAYAFAEDQWARIKIGSIEFDLPKRCERCIIINTDQSTADRGAEPLKTLFSYRRSEKGKAIFGQNMIHLGEGTLKVGDEVTVL